MEKQQQQQPEESKTDRIRRSFLKRTAGFTVSFILVDAVPALADPHPQKDSTCDIQDPDSTCGEEIVGFEHKDSDEACFQGAPDLQNYDSDQNCGNVSNRVGGVDHHDEDDSCTKQSTAAATPGGPYDDTDQSCNKNKNSVYTDDDGNCGNSYGGVANHVHEDQTCGKQTGANSYDADQSCGLNLGGSWKPDKDEQCDHGHSFIQSEADRDEFCGQYGTGASLPDPDQFCRPGTHEHGFDQDDNCGNQYSGGPNSPDGDGKS